MLGLTAVEAFLVIIAVFAVSYWIIPQKYSWLSFLIAAVMLAWLGFNIEPDVSDDLSRYFKALDEMREEGYDGLLRYIEEDQFDFKTFRVSAYYVYFISKLGNDHWLPCITMFIVYSLNFYCIYKASVHFNINKGHTFLGTLFFLCTYWYYDTCSGTRNGLAFAIVVACSYQLIVERKHKILCYIGLVIACFTHSAGIIPVVLVLLAELTFNTSGKFLNFLLVFGILCGAAGIRFLGSISDSNFIQSLLGKVDRNEAGTVLETGTMFRVNMVVLFIVLGILLYFSYFILNCDYTKDLRRFYKYTSIITYFCIGALFSGLIFVRFARWILPVLGGLLYMIGMKSQSLYIEEKGLNYCLYYAPFKAQARVKLRCLVSLVYVVFTAIHMWYMCNGSSLIWMHFDYEY